MHCLLKDTFYITNQYCFFIIRKQIIISITILKYCKQSLYNYINIINVKIKSQPLVL